MTLYKSTYWCSLLRWVCRLPQLCTSARMRN